MLRGICPLLFGLASCLVGPSLARAQVVDNAEMFRPGTVAEANKIIRGIKQKFNRDVRVETYHGIPESKKKEYDRLRVKPGGKNKFYDDWAAERIRETHANGVFILVTTDPDHVHVASGRETARGDFTHYDCDNVQRALQDSIDTKNFDNGLIDGLERVRNAMVANKGERSDREVAKPAAPNRPEDGVNEQPDNPAGAGPWGWLCPLVIIGAGVWLVIGLIRAFTGAGRSQMGAPGYGPGYGGGGGFMSGLMGGLFGAMAGNWMYHSFFGGGMHGPSFGGSAYGGEPNFPSAPDEGRFGTASGGDMDADVGTDAGGGDFGAGGDFGTGGDFGGDAGGDFGGGDFGGGGDY